MQNPSPIDEGFWFVHPSHKASEDTVGPNPNRSSPCGERSRTTERPALPEAYGVHVVAVPNWQVRESLSTSLIKYPFVQSVVAVVWLDAERSDQIMLYEE